jgi:hypothetical protein
VIAASNFDGIESVVGNLHCPSSAILTLKRSPFESSRTVDVGVLNRGEGSENQKMINSIIRITEGINTLGFFNFRQNLLNKMDFNLKRIEAKFSVSNQKVLMVNGILYYKLFKKENKKGTVKCPFNIGLKLVYYFEVSTARSSVLALIEMV